jgi:protoheme IX farnesyltransferase
LPYTHFTGTLQLSGFGAIGVVAVGLIMLYYAAELMKKKNDQAARKLMLSSVFYISAVQLIYVIDKFVFYGN